MASRPSPNCDLLRLLQLHAGIQHISAEPSDRIHSQDPFNSLMSRNLSVVVSSMAEAMAGLPHCCVLREAHRVSSLLIPLSG